jgi:hypothetical protein
MIAAFLNWLEHVLRSVPVSNECDASVEFYACVGYFGTGVIVDRVRMR